MRVTLYKSTDGKLHETHAAYVAHEASLRTLKAVGEATSLDFSSGEMEGDAPYAWDVNTLAQFISDNAAELRKILNDAAVSSRGRKTSKKGKTS